MDGREANVHLAPPVPAVTVSVTVSCSHGSRERADIVSLWGLDDGL